MELIIPKRYKLKLLPETTEIAIKFIKDSFQERLAKRLNLRRVTAPLFVLSGTGLNDDLNGVEHAVGFDIKAMGNRHAGVVHSLAKWKRPGVWNVEEFDPDPFMEQLNKQGLPWHEIFNSDLEV